VPTARTCQVSFMDSENIGRSVEVTREHFYEGAVLAMAEFRRCGFTSNAPGGAATGLGKAEGVAEDVTKWPSRRARCN